MFGSVSSNFQRTLVVSIVSFSEILSDFNVGSLRLICSQENTESYPRIGSIPSCTTAAMHFGICSISVDKQRMMHTHLQKQLPSINIFPWNCIGAILFGKNCTLMSKQYVETCFK